MLLLDVSVFLGELEHVGVHGHSLVAVHRKKRYTVGNLPTHTLQILQLFLNDFVFLCSEVFEPLLASFLLDVVHCCSDVVSPIAESHLFHLFRLGLRQFMNCRKSVKLSVMGLFYELAVLAPQTVEHLGDPRYVVVRRTYEADRAFPWLLSQNPDARQPLVHLSKPPVILQPVVGNGLQPDRLVEVSIELLFHIFLSVGKHLNLDVIAVNP